MGYISKKVAAYGQFVLVFYAFNCKKEINMAKFAPPPTLDSTKELYTPKLSELRRMSPYLWSGRTGLLGQGRRCLRGWGTH